MKKCATQNKMSGVSDARIAVTGCPAGSTWAEELIAGTFYNYSCMIATRTPTVEELLSGSERCEFVQGAKVEKDLPSFQHGQFQVILGAALTTYGRQSGLGAAVSEWHHRFGPEDDVRVYIPDIVFLKAPRHLNPPRYANEASDVMIEIVSPTDSPTGLLDKVEFYLYYGALSVWVVDPTEKRIHIYSPGKPVRRFTPLDTLTDPVLPGFALPLSEIFG